MGLGCDRWLRFQKEHDSMSTSTTGATAAGGCRHDWTLAEVRELFATPLMELVYRAAQVHRQFHDASEVQVCKLISIKTGGCPEDCSYCSQSARYETEIKAQPL